MVIEVIVMSSWMCCIQGTRRSTTMNAV